jgi:hypothetical protein
VEGKRFCIYCGAENPAEAVFCIACGKQQPTGSPGRRRGAGAPGGWRLRDNDAIPTSEFWPQSCVRSCRATVAHAHHSGAGHSCAADGDTHPHFDAVSKHNSHCNFNARAANSHPNGDTKPHLDCCSDSHTHTTYTLF